MAGYSGTALVKKLGIRPGEPVCVINAPAHYAQLLGKLPEGAVLSQEVSDGVAFVHLFVAKRSKLKTQLKRLRSKLADAGMLWVSWPKKAARVPTDVTEDVIRAEALPLGFVDVKVCAVDETWSGLKLMIRRTERGKKRI
ncbi:MAG: DUF3052 domain-containing protein [Chthoniobacterales bacterium]